MNGLHQGQAVQCIAPQVDGDLRGTIARVCPQPDGSELYVFEAETHNEAPFPSQANPFFGPLPAEHFKRLKSRAK